MDRRTFLQFVAYTGAGILAGCQEECQKREMESNKVLFIGIDGCRPDALQLANTPAIDKLIEEGAYSFKAQAGTNTVTAPGWTNSFTGVWEAKHGVTDNTFDGARYKQYPSLVTRIEEYHPEKKTISLVCWEGINKHILKSADVKISHHVYNHQQGDKRVLLDSLRILSKGNVDFMFVYFANIDGIGHKHGFNPKNKKYISEIERVDGYIGQIVTRLKNRTHYDKENWLILAATDHGGKGHSHGGTSPEEKTIFYITSGKSAARGEIIHPPDNRPPNQVDIAPTILTHMKIPIKPEWDLDGKVSGLK